MRYYYYNSIFAMPKSIKLNDIILNIQNIALFGISIYSLYSCINYYIITGQTANVLTHVGQTNCLIPTDTCHVTENDYTKALQPFYNILFFIKLHACIDIFFVKTTGIFLHHLFSIGISFYGWYNNVISADNFIFSYSLIKTEVSSIFYVLKYWIPEKTYAYTINLLLFYVLFFKLRIIDLYNEIIYGNYAFDMIINKYSPTNTLMSGVFYVSVYGLYILNLYWFLIMTKILYKKVLKNTTINTDKMCRYICSYIHYVNIPLAVCMYSYNKHEKNIFDISGIFMLSISSHLYHYDMYNKIHTNQIKELIVTEYMDCVHFFNDYLCINIRSFLAVVTNYYNKPWLCEVMIVCGIFQLGCIYCGFINVIELLRNPAYIKSNFLTIHYAFTFLPITINIFAIYLNTKSHEIAIPFLFVSICIILVFMVEPFYKLTHVAFHIMLIVQTYYVCLSNSE